MSVSTQTIWSTKKQKIWLGFWIWLFSPKILRLVLDIAQNPHVCSLTLTAPWAVNIIPLKSSVPKANFHESEKYDMGVKSWRKFFCLKAVWISQMSSVFCNLYFPEHWQLSWHTTCALLCITVILYSLPIDYDYKGKNSLLCYRTVRLI